MESGKFIRQLADYIRHNNHHKLYIQTHNFPDADAVASAFALKKLLKEREGLNATIIYEGYIQRAALLGMIERFDIPIHHRREMNLQDDDFIIIVDGCKSYKNVTDLPGDEICVIDHHQTVKPEDVPLADIRPYYGSCSTIIVEYFRSCDQEPGRNLASVLLIGLLQDTDQLTREVDDADLDAFNWLYRRSNREAVQYSLRNFIELKDLKVFTRVINSLKIEGILATCYLPEGCPPSLLGIIGDFLLALEEIEFVVLFARNNGQINISLRNEIKGVNAAEVARTILQGIGGGGGHETFAGGLIPDADNFNAEVMEQRLREILPVLKK